MERLSNDIAKKGKELAAVAKPFIEKYVEPEDVPMLEDALQDFGALLPEVVSNLAVLAGFCFVVYCLSVGISN